MGCIESTTCRSWATPSGASMPRYRRGTNLLLLSPDVAQFFPDEQSVNAALRSLIHVAKDSLKRSR